METEPVVVLTTAPDPEVGARLARGLVEKRLAACVNLIPQLRSFYSWKGVLNDEPEVQLIVKTRKAKLAELETWLRREHPYEVPELLWMSIDGGSEAYLRWVSEQT